MSVISSATASAASTAADVFVHGQKKRGSGAIGDSTSSSSAQNPASTQGLFSSLLQSLEQVAGISTSSAATASAGTTSVTGNAASKVASGAVGSNPAAASYGAQLAGAGVQATRAVGGKLNTSA